MYRNNEQRIADACTHQSCTITSATFHAFICCAIWGFKVWKMSKCMQTPNVKWRMTCIATYNNMFCARGVVGMRTCITRNRKLVSIAYAHTFSIWLLISNLP